MFTGLVEETGALVSLQSGLRSARITLQCKTIHRDAAIGDSIAINGCCLTVVQIDSDRLTFDAIPETLDRTNLGALLPGEAVNLERPLRANARLDGHFVQGHVDGVGVVRSVRTEENAVVLEIAPPDNLLRYFVEKGSVAVDGVSLTVAALLSHSFTVWTIPHTREITNLGARSVGDRVNLECDLIGKYIERLLQSRGVLAAPESVGVSR